VGCIAPCSLLLGLKRFVHPILSAASMKSLAREMLAYPYNLFNTLASNSEIQTFDPSKAIPPVGKAEEVAMIFPSLGPNWPRRRKASAHLQS
jgi:hypothetical protein